LAEEHWNRAARELDQENVDIRREGVAGEKAQHPTTRAP
jgi:hypothetical protein